jgi:TPR repeat protein
MMYRDGLGREQDDVEAYKWFTLSATQGHEDAVRERETLTSEMDAAQITEAQRLAREWLAQHQK